MGPYNPMFWPVQHTVRRLTPMETLSLREYLSYLTHQLEMLKRTAGEINDATLKDLWTRTEQVLEKHVREVIALLNMRTVFPS
ncbi:MAG: hypothetical protein BSOLF_0499 [Candidatus Carbobacillus altaicus]|uniref:Uncharacterized protein n=1 Tax=Candidatus Carbonibacillus altaicus TaxID=2163959 RepID=A0A2R6Y0W4_9BACL|nr:MAG: hypothetical protein BSOLF_0499 [Candidatus Carbobacillus altaicus]